MKYSDLMTQIQLKGKLTDSYWDLEDLYIHKEEYIEIPEYAYDVHTRKGKRMGKTKKEFFNEDLLDKVEEEFLSLVELGLNPNSAFDAVTEFGEIN